MRWAAKRDGNEASIIALFEAHGCAVKQLSQWKVADLLVSWPKHPPPTNRALRAWTGRICLVEVKRKGQDVNEGQAEFKTQFPVWLCRTCGDVSEVLEWLKTT